MRATFGVTLSDPSITITFETPTLVASEVAFPDNQLVGTLSAPRS